MKKLATKGRIAARLALKAAVEGFKAEWDLEKIARSVRADWQTHQVEWHVWKTTKWSDEPATKLSNTYRYATFGIGGYDDACLLVTMGRINEEAVESQLLSKSRCRVTWSLHLHVPLPNHDMAWINCETGEVKTTVREKKADEGREGA